MMADLSPLLLGMLVGVGGNRRLRDLAALLRDGKRGKTRETREKEKEGGLKRYLQV